MEIQVQRLTDNFYFFRDDLIEVLRDNERFSYCCFSKSEEGVNGFHSDWSFESRSEASAFARRRSIKNWCEWYPGCAWVSSYFNDEILYLSDQTRTTLGIAPNVRNTDSMQLKKEIMSQPYQGRVYTELASTTNTPVLGQLNAKLVCLDEHTVWIVWEFTPDNCCRS